MAPKRSPWLKPMPAEGEVLAFVFVNAIDVFVTHLMLWQGGFTESNPVAMFFIAHWGIKGMVYYKFAMVSFVCIIAWIVSQRRPELARGMLRVGTLIVVAVVVYSLTLLARHGDLF